MTDPISPEEVQENLRQRITDQDADRKAKDRPRGYPKLEGEELMLRSINQLDPDGNDGINIHALVGEIVARFTHKGGLGKAIVDLYTDTKSDNVKARLMIEILKLVNTLSLDGDDDAGETTDEIDAVIKEYEARAQDRPDSPD